MALTVTTSANVPKPMLAAARERWPQLSNSQILRYALAIALGSTESDALAITRDPRIGVRRKTIIE